MTILPGDKDTREHQKFAQAGHVSIGGPDLITQLDYDGSNNLIYVGIAVIGSLTSQAVWQIRKLSYSGTNLTSVKWAATTVGNASPALALFNQIWDNRVSLTYS